MPLKVYITEMIYLTKNYLHFCNQEGHNVVILFSNMNYHLMEKKAKGKKVRICKRCNKNVSEDLLCTSCKVELLNKYDSKIDWKTAFDIERIQQSAMRYIDDDL